jgi:hypothetical protein
MMWTNRMWCVKMSVLVSVLLALLIHTSQTNGYLVLFSSLVLDTKQNQTLTSLLEITFFFAIRQLVHRFYSIHFRIREPRKLFTLTLISRNYVFVNIVYSLSSQGLALIHLKVIVSSFLVKSLVEIWELIKYIT